MPHIMGPKPLPIKERFMQHVVIDSNGCWLWTAGLDSHGYGLFKAKYTRRATRVSYEIFKEPFDPRLWVLHHCDTPRCVNPEHLFLGTVKDNTQDAFKKGRLNR